MQYVIALQDMAVRVFPTLEAAELWLVERSFQRDQYYHSLWSTTRPSACVKYGVLAKVLRLSESEDGERK